LQGKTRVSPKNLHAIESHDLPRHAPAALEAAARATRAFGEDASALDQAAASLTRNV
jgi:hypothetical protein